MAQRFGGDWTDQKLEAVSSYLEAWLLIFEKNERAHHFRRIYVDGFAGAGMTMRNAAKEDAQLSTLFGEQDAKDVEAFAQGSALRAMNASRSFHEYLFIEKRADYAAQLADEVRAHPLADRVSIVRKDANDALREWVYRTDWSKSRAVVFLDPYGMQVDFDTLKVLADTRGIDLWLLVPVGMAMIRVMPKVRKPDEGWSRGLTRLFGNDEWHTLYQQTPRASLFNDEDVVSERTADHQQVGEFYLSRLKTIFADVCPHGARMLSSTGCPLYWLCFAAANEKGAPTAIRIAKHLIKKINDGG